MTLSRRDFLAFVIGGTAGGALATTTGLTYYYYRRSRWTPGGPPVAGLQADGGWMLSQKDLDAFSGADALVESETLTMLDNADIPGGGDYEWMRVQNLGECVSACEADSRCRAFTYARSTHASPEKRQMCWLKKNDPERVVTDLITYVSGHR